MCDIIFIIVTPPDQMRVGVGLGLGLNVVSGHGVGMRFVYERLVWSGCPQSSLFSLQPVSSRL